MGLPVAYSRTGLIPARAGNTNIGGGNWVADGAHPRSRGEHSGHPSGYPLLWGSSPLARGTQTIITKLTL